MPVDAITGVSTSIAAFVVRVESSDATGPNMPLPRFDRLVTVADFAQIALAMPGIGRAEALPSAVQQFFGNGGSEACVAQISEGASVSDGLAVLDEVQGLGMICLPGEADPAVLREVLEYAEDRRVFLIIDPPGEDIEAAMELARVMASAGSPNGAMFYPPVRVADPATGQVGTRSAGGAVAGLFARIDRTRGVWRAPAGREATLLGVDSPAVALSEDDAEKLRAVGINPIRDLPHEGTFVWATRTLQGADGTDSQWKYISVRRTALFIEESMDRGTRWVRFEPNVEPTWAKVRASAERFLDGLFQAGAFQGKTPSEAYFVRCDRTTMTQNDLGNRRMVLLAGFAPQKPAEFLEIRIEQLCAPGDEGLV
jgi:Bacteriophage tail sheath protein